MSESSEDKWIVPKQLPETLSEYGYDLTFQAYNDLLHPLIRDDAYETRILQILSRKSKHSPMLLGAENALERNVIEGVAIRIAKANANGFANTQIISLRLDQLLKCDQVRIKFNRIVEEIRTSDHKIILYVEGLDKLIMYPDKALFDQDFRIALRRYYVQFICSTTLKAYRETIEVDAALDFSFSTVFLTSSL